MTPNIFTCMKRIKGCISVYVLMLLFCCNVCNTYAQAGDEFCGDWVGTYPGRLYENGKWRDTQNKMYIRINKIDSEYTVRIKSQSPGYEMKYWPTCENVSRQGNTLHFTIDLGNDYDWDADDRHKGQRIKYSHDVIHGSVSVRTGSICYSDYMIILKSATTRLYDTEAKIICIVSKKGAQCIECHHKDI